MSTVKILTDLIMPEAAALGFDLVRVKIFGGDDQILQVMAERPETRQLNIDDCAALSRRISEKLDVLEETGKDPMDGAYRLEVSSPGIDRPLTRAQDYADWAGHEAKIALVEKIDGRQRFQGILQGLDDAGSAAVLTDKMDVTFQLPLDQIESAKLVLTDTLIAETARLSTQGADLIEEEG